MDEITKELWIKIRNGEVDINNIEPFLPIISKGFIYKLNHNLKLRNINIPHYILNTGDDIMYLEVKGQNQAIEPLEVSNENFVYSQIPRCMVQPAGVNIPTDQLTSPYSYGMFQVEYEDMIYAFRAEFRRMPLTINYNLKYYFDNLTDALNVSQQIITNLAFINNFQVTYLGQKIPCSYKIPEELQTEFMVEFDGVTTDSKNRTMSLDLEVQTNIPVVYPGTVIPGDAYIKQFKMEQAVIPVDSNTNNIMPDDGNNYQNPTTGPIKEADSKITYKSGEFSTGITLYPKGSGIKQINPGIPEKFQPKQTNLPIDK